MKRVCVCDVRGLRGEARKAVCYVGRSFAGWPYTEWGNHGFRPCPGQFRAHLLSLPRAELNGLLVRLWEACEHGAKPLGCWCGVWKPGDPPLACHAYVWAELLNAKYESDSHE